MKEIKELASKFDDPPVDVMPRLISDESVLVHIKRSAKNVVLPFLIIWLVGCSMLSIDPIRSVLAGNLDDIIFAISMSGIGVFCFLSIISLIFRRDSFFLKSDRLVVGRKILFWEKNTIIYRKSIAKVLHKKIGTENGAPRWRVAIELENESKEKIKYEWMMRLRDRKNVLSWEPEEKTLWLGELISNWAGVELTEVEY